MHKQVQAGNAQSILRRELDCLPACERAVLLLRIQGRKSYGEISSLTGVSEGNVGSLVERGLRDLVGRLRARGVI